MSARRFVPLRRPVTIALDGDRVEAEEGEPVAQALVAADKLTLARSPKLHRPRGPWCLRGGCDGCLARVDGAPNVMSCLVPAAEGTQVETQNVLGSRTVDLLRVTDWFFPDGIDHHHLLAGVPGLSSVMQAFARRVAGLGTLPDRPLAPGAGAASEVDALVVGGGPSGLAAASALGRRGRSVALVDDALALGGGARALGAEALAGLLRSCPLDGVRVLAPRVAAGVYEGACLVVAADAAELLRPRALVLAAGAHDGGLLFENNDLPGVFSARAAAQMAASGVAVGQRIALAGQGPFGRALRSHLEGHAEFVAIDPAELRKAEGSSRVGAVVLGDDRRRVRCDALVIEAPASPSFELAEQGGAEVRWTDGRGYAPRADARGLAAPRLWVAGEARGLPFDLQRLIADGRSVAAAVDEALGLPRASPPPAARTCRARRPRTPARTRP